MLSADGTLTAVKLSTAQFGGTSQQTGEVDCPATGPINKSNLHVMSHVLHVVVHVVLHVVLHVVFTLISNGCPAFRLSEE